MFSVVKKSVAAVGVAVATVLLLSACMKFDVDLTVSGDDTVSGTVTVGLSKEMAALGEGQNEEGWSESEGSSGSGGSDGFSGLFADGPGVEEVPYEDEKFIGTSYTFKSVPLENFAVDESNTSKISIVREGDNLVTSGTFDMMGDATTGADGFSSDDALSSQVFETLGESAEMQISITYPGQVLETNGTVDGQTVTWTPKFGETLEMSAVVKAPQINWALLIGVGIGVLLIVLVAVGVVLFIVLRKKKRKHADATAAASTDRAVEGASEAPPEPGASTEN